MRSRPPLSHVVERNVEALLTRAAERRQSRGWQDRLAATITHFTGSLGFVLMHIALVGAWVTVNLGWTPIPPFDPTFVLLATIASVEAIFLTSFVLITQNIMQGEDDQRADLNLQIALLTEHELTRLIALVTDIAERLDVRPPADPELEELKREVAPEEVLDTLEAKKRARQDPPR